MKNNNKKETLLKDLVNQMFIYAKLDITYDYLIKKNDTLWFKKYSWTLEEENIFKKWAVKYVSKVLKIPMYKGKLNAEKEVSFFLFSYGLSIKNI